MKKIFALMLLSLGVSGIAQAQLTEGKPTATTVRTGNRMGKGDYGIYLGATSDMFKRIGDDDFKVKPLPLINLKYMVTDRLETRLGIEFYRSTEKLSGTQEFTELVEMDPENPTEEPKTKTVKKDASAKFVEADNRIMPGIAYHFSNSNILDVYAGAEVILGWTRNDGYDTFDKDESSVRQSAFQLGAGAFIGLQAFIGNLPIALGVEYGISTRWDTNLRTKSFYKDATDSKTVFTPDPNQFVNLSGNELLNGKFESLTASKGKIANQVRITLTYFFKAK